MISTEARPLIIREWDRWIRKQSFESLGPGGRESLRFFVELQDGCSALLNFDPRGRDKWQLIHSWLLAEGRVHTPLAETRRTRQYRRMIKAREAQPVEGGIDEPA